MLRTNQDEITLLLIDNQYFEHFPALLPASPTTLMVVQPQDRQPQSLYLAMIPPQTRVGCKVKWYDMSSWSGMNLEYDRSQIQLTKL
ncbi:hypothetical protein Pmani_000689 [Petrolisthes manimaculis]|uniref:Uncharacterized protein n=1 Tax=Petrolisthes manimaculis TaxID=1843537 RepID=A0AAE1QLZ8_9EUCA|nr:hypothetical protein Pmani_000689 [Petrolisthes manimaculis]